MMSLQEQAGLPGAEAKRPVRLGAVFPALADARELPMFAARAEELGFAELWVIEDCFLSGGIALAATALAVTRSIVVGIGLLPASVRNPATVAMDLATLASIHPGRLVVTFGHGEPDWMARVGALPQRRLEALAETTLAVRRLLAGETVTTNASHVRLSAVALDRPPALVPPVLVGTTGPRGLAIAGRCGDGVLLPEGCGPAFVRWAREQLGEASGKRCAVYAWFSMDADPGRARMRLAPAVDHWLQSGIYPHPKQMAGAPPQDEDARLRLIDQLSVCGDAGACVDAVRRFAAAGAETVVLAAPAPEHQQQLEAFATRVMPALMPDGMA